MSKPKFTIHHGSNLDILPTLPDNSVDSIVTDPPYELGFMGKAWDSTGIAYNVQVWKECMRVLKHGGHLIAFGGSRTYHRMAVAIEDAGFEVRDQMMWVYGSGFPKSHNISKALDKTPKAANRLGEFSALLKAKREAMGISVSDADKMITGGSTMYSFLEGRSINGVTKTYPPRKDYYSKIVEVFGISGWDDIVENNLNVTGEKEGDFGFQKDGKRWGGCSKVVEATTDEAKKWDGWGTALKPAHEPMVLARKPIEGTIAENVLKWGVGGINIDACRVEAQGENFDNLKDRTDMTGKLTIHHEGGNLEALDKLKRLGRFPANLMHDGSQEVLDLFPESNGGHWSYKQAKDGGLYEHGLKDLEDGGSDKQGGSAARFFYCPKANKKDRNEGCEDLQEKENKFGNQKNGDDIGNGSVNDKFTTAPNKNSHPTVKPTELMRYLCRLITPQNGTVLDPFNGSGSTGKGAILEGFNYVGIELDAEYIKISEARIKAVL